MKNKGLTIILASGIAMLLAMAAIAQSPLGGFRPASVPSKYFTPEEAIARAIVHSHQQQQGNHNDIILQNKAMLENSSIAQQRVSQSVARLQGKNPQPSIVDSKLSELDKTIRLLDDVLAEVDALQPADKAAYQQAISQRTNENLLRQALPLYWEINGYRNTAGLLAQALNQTRQYLDQFIKERRKPTAEEEQHRQTLLQLLADLKSLQENSSERMNMFAALIGVAAEDLGHTLFLPVKNLPIPEIDLDYSQFDNSILEQWSTEKTITLDIVNKYLASITPGLGFDWQASDNSTVGNWLSTGLNNAFDLYILLNRLERRKLLKEKDEKQTSPALMITAATFTRSHLALLKYQFSREIFTLSHCQKSISESFTARKKLMLDEGLASGILKLKLQKQYIENTQQFFRDYGTLVSDLVILKSSIFNTKLPAGMESGQIYGLKRVLKKILEQSTRKLDSNIYSCYQSETQVTEAANRITTLQKERDAETQRANQLAAKLDDLTNKEKLKKRAAEKARKDWVKQTSPRAWTLQLKTATDLTMLQAFKDRYKLGKEARITETTHKGKTRFNLLYGTYPNKELAYIAQFKLPQSIQDNEKIWIRRYSDIQKQVK